MTFESPSDETIAPNHGSAPEASTTGARERVAVLVDQFAETQAAAVESGSAAEEPKAPPQSTANILSTLESLGYEPVELAFEAKKANEWLKRLIAGDFQLAFNLCETLAGRADGEHLTAAAVELLELPMTGASSATLLYCLDKDYCAAVLRAHRINVPDWTVVREHDSPPTEWKRFPAIIKPAAQDGSNGIHSSSVVRSKEELLGAVAHLREHWGDVLVQEFIEGREINLAIVDNHLLPPAEIDFSTLPEGSPPIVSYEAKWVSGSPEDLGTRPVCPAPLPNTKTKELQQLAARVWMLMGGGGYARVDVRLTADGTPYVIDVNPNPDLSLDAGLARQAQVAGWSYEALIERIIEAALRPGGEAGHPSPGWTFVEPTVPTGAVS